MDGVVVQSGHRGDQGIIGRMIDKGIPIVVLGRPFRSDNVSYIDIDNIIAAYNAVTHLIRVGYQRIAHNLWANDQYGWHRPKKGVFESLERAEY